MLQGKIRELESHLEIAKKNLAIAKDPTIFEVVSEEYKRITDELESKRAEHEALAYASPTKDLGSPVEEVEKAMSLAGSLQAVGSDPALRAAFPQLCASLGIRIGLSFVDGIKGKSRKVRKLQSGVIAFGHAELPVPTHGADAVETLIELPNGGGTTTKNEAQNASDPQITRATVARKRVKTARRAFR